MHNVRMKPKEASNKESTWLVLQRDLRLWLRDVEQPTYLTMVMDLTIEGTRAVEAGATPSDSLFAAVRLAAWSHEKEFRRAFRTEFRSPSNSQRHCTP